MKRIFFSAFLPFALLMNLIAQATLEERLRQHVYTLAADSLMGRKAGSDHAKMAADYIAAQWKEIGIAPLSGESYFLPFRQNKYHNLAAIIERNDTVLKNEYFTLGFAF